MRRHRSRGSPGAPGSPGGRSLASSAEIFLQPGVLLALPHPSFLLETTKFPLLLPGGESDQFLEESEWIFLICRLAGVCFSQVGGEGVETLVRGEFSSLVQNCHSILGCSDILTDDKVLWTANCLSCIFWRF